MVVRRFGDVEHLGSAGRPRARRAPVDQRGAGATGAGKTHVVTVDVTEQRRGRERGGGVGKSPGEPLHGDDNEAQHLKSGRRASAVSQHSVWQARAVPDASDTAASLRGAIDEVLATQDRRSVTAASARLTESYRTGERRQHVRSDADAAAYAAVRLPATYGALTAALRAVAERDPGFAPVTLLDLGAGSGAAAWAARSVWPSLAGLDLVDVDDRMLRVGQALRQAAERQVTDRKNAAVAEGYGAGSWRWRQAELTAYQPDRHDLVVASYTLNELAPAERLAVARRAWAGTTGTLVVVEPGTPIGFAVVRELREALIADGGTVLAPCPHDGGCPMRGADWCHFAARVPRSALHRQVKGGDLSYEDEKFSYVALTRRPAAAPAAARILRHPVKPPRRVELRVCAPGGVRRVTVGKSRAGYRSARELRWGDAVPPDLLD